MTDKGSERILKNIRSLVLDNGELSVDQKVIFCIVVTLSGSRGFCWVSNIALSRALDLSVCDVRKIVDSLEHLKLLHIEKKGSNRRLWIYGEYEEEVTSIKKKKEDD